MLLWFGLIVALLMVPFAAGIGVSVRDVSEVTASAQRAALHQVQAVTLDDSARAIPVAPGEALSRVRVRYADAQGAPREAIAAVAIGTPTGTQVSIWLNDSGQAVTGPRTPADSALLGAWSGVFTLLVLWFALWVVLRVLRVPLDRRRAREWDDRWQEIAPRWIRGQK